MIYEVIWTNRFKKSYKRCKKRGLPIQELKDVVEKLRNKGDYQRVLDVIKDADNVVFSLPLYIDCLPSHVLPFLKEAETMCKENGINFNVYSIINNGFIEGCQSEPVLRILKNFSDRAGLTFCGGIGIGGGVMLNVTRIIFLVQIGLFLLNLVLNFIQNGLVFPLYLLFYFLLSINSFRPSTFSRTVIC